MQWRTRFDLSLKEWWFSISTLFVFHVEISLLNLILDIKPFLFKIQTETFLPQVYKHFFKSFFCKGFNITEYKRGEFQIWFENTLNTGIEIFKTIHTDHARFEFGVGILGFSIHFSIYDIRHWDDENNKFEGEEENESVL